MLQALSAGSHIADDITLPFVERAELFTLQEFNVSIQDGEGCLEIVCCRSQGVRSPLKTFSQLMVILNEIRRVVRVSLSPRWNGTHLVPCSRRLGKTRFIRTCGHRRRLSWFRKRGGETPSQPGASGRTTHPIEGWVNLPCQSKRHQNC